jgi:hypothetical protein
MEKEAEVKSYLKKLEKIIPYWVKHNSEHIDEHQKWMKDAQKLGLAEVADELESVIGLLKKANKHIDSIKEKMNK